MLLQWPWDYGHLTVCIRGMPLDESSALIMKLQVLSFEDLDVLWFLDDYLQTLEACFFWIWLQVEEEEGPLVFMTLALEPEISFAKIPQILSRWTSVAELSWLWPLLRRTSWPLEGWRAVIRITVIGLPINLQRVDNRRLAEVLFVKGRWEHHFVLLMAHFVT